MNKEWLLKRSDELVAGTAAVADADRQPAGCHLCQGRRRPEDDGQSGRPEKSQVAKPKPRPSAKRDFDFFPREIAEKFYDDDQKVMQGEPVINREEYFLDDEGPETLAVDEQAAVARSRTERSSAWSALAGTSRSTNWRKTSWRTNRRCSRRCWIICPIPSISRIASRASCG